ncbi:unnamed protein product [Paramecium pentaurelia]|uniref:Ubiquitin-like protease family profile domain-containing protein n=1 Tax=Paramecium pentaurelia TaxID=43138 RepID=A0A8S1SID0_9CILI|nr:unnamed protein product [Paramecium pentaurelia]
MGCIDDKEDEQKPTKSQTSSKQIKEEFKNDLQTTQSQNVKESTTYYKDDLDHLDRISKNKSLDGNTNECWVKDCQKFKYDLINTIKGKYVCVLLFKNIQFYYNKIIRKIKVQQYQDANVYEIEGFIYLTKDDSNFNPKYKLQQGIFFKVLGYRKFNQMNKVKNIKESQHQQGTLVSLKMENIYLNQRIQQTILIMISRHKEITKKLLLQIRQQEYIQNFWCQYNQLISNNDVNILKNKRWITSIIIHSYVLKLNLDSEKEIEVQTYIIFTNYQFYYQLLKQTLIKRRQLIYQNKNYLNIHKWIQKQQEFIGKLDFQSNKNNCYWYFLFFDAEMGLAQIFNSTQISNDIIKENQKLIDTLAFILKITIESTQIQKQSGEQRNSYSCEYNICNL